MVELRRAAALLKYGLLNGFTTVGEAVTWADAEIEAQDSPHAALLEVSTSSSRIAADVAIELNPLAAGCTETEIVEEMLALMYSALCRDRTTAPRIASELYRLAVDGVHPSESALREMFYFYDALDIARCNISGTEAEVIAEMLGFLRPFSTAAPV
jgi:hypothetical protein